MNAHESGARIGPAQAAGAVLEALDAGEAIAVALLVAGGAGAGRPGDRLLLRERAEAEEISGTLGSADLDAAAAAVAREALAGAGPATREVEGGGQGARIFVEAHLPADELVIVGAGHIALPLARLGALLGFQVTVLDDREEFASEARFPEAARVLRTELEPPADPFRDVRLTRRSYVVLVTRAHRYDFDCLSALLRADRPMPRYLGMIGSRRRVKGAFEALLHAGLPRERLARVHAPIGLDIGAETPEEIAISIAAEIVRVRRGHTGSTAPRSELEQVLGRLLPEETP